MNSYNCLRYLLGLSIAYSSFAAITTPATNGLPSDLIKVTSENNPKCVTFVFFKGEMYCSVINLDKTPVDAQALANEKQRIQFDNRPWMPAWAQKTAKVSTIEYLPVGEKMDNWNELITSQFFPKATGSPSEFGNQFIYNLNKLGITYKVNSIINQPDVLMFEFRVTKPENLQQDEIQKVVKTKDGLYVLHYAIKKSDMGDEARKQWIERLRNSSLK